MGYIRLNGVMKTFGNVMVSLPLNLEIEHGRPVVFVGPCRPSFRAWHATTMYLMNGLATSITSSRGSPTFTQEPAASMKFSLMGPRNRSPLSGEAGSKSSPASPVRY